MKQLLEKKRLQTNAGFTGAATARARTHTALALGSRARRTPLLLKFLGGGRTMERLLLLNSEFIYSRAQAARLVIHLLLCNALGNSHKMPIAVHTGSRSV